MRGRLEIVVDKYKTVINAQDHVEAVSDDKSNTPKNSEIPRCC